MAAGYGPASLMPRATAVSILALIALPISVPEGQSQKEPNSTISVGIAPVLTLPIWSQSVTKLISLAVYIPEAHGLVIAPKGIPIVSGIPTFPLEMVVSSAGVGLVRLSGKKIGGAASPLGRELPNSGNSTESGCVIIALVSQVGAGDEIGVGVRVAVAVGVHVGVSGT